MTLLTVQQAAEILQVSDKTIRRLVWAHELAHHRIGSAIRIPESALRNYLERTLVT